MMYSEMEKDELETLKEVMKNFNREEMKMFEDEEKRATMLSFLKNFSKKNSKMGRMKLVAQKLKKYAQD